MQKPHFPVTSLNPAPPLLVGPKYRKYMPDEGKKRNSTFVLAYFNGRWFEAWTLGPLGYFSCIYVYIFSSYEVRFENSRTAQAIFLKLRYKLKVLIYDKIQK